MPERHGPWALVLGASEGTGREFARQLAADGIPSVLIARREAPLERLKAEIARDYGVECGSATVDQPGMSPQSAAERRARRCREPDHRSALRNRKLSAADALAARADRMDITDLICAQDLHTLHHSYQVLNIVIALDGDRAGSEAYCTASLRIERGGMLRQMTIWNRYIDRWEKHAGRWGLVKRLTIRDFDEVREASEMQRHDRGHRDSTDPSYEVLRDRLKIRQRRISPHQPSPPPYHPLVVSCWW